MNPIHTKALVAALAVLLSVSLGRADSINVVDPDFNMLLKPGSTTVTATIPTGSYTQGFTNASVQAGSATYSDGTTGSGITVEGWTADAGDADTAFGVNGGGGPAYFNGVNFDGQPSTVYQDLGVGLQADSTYTLTAQVSNPLGDPNTASGYYPAATPIVFDLYVGGTLLTPTTTNDTTPTTGAETFTQTYDINAPVGLGDLIIRLGDAVGTYDPNNNRPAPAGSQTDFTSIALSVSPNSVATPEPSVTGLLILGLGAALLVGLRRRMA